MSDRRIRFNGFKCSTVAHTTAGLWRHPTSQSHRYKELSFWTELAMTLERGKFDGLFIADALGVLDVYRGSPDQTLREGLQTPTDDPLLAVSAMAAVTRHLGFGITVSSLYEQPYLFARKMTTLDHLTQGRIGWNIVTSALDSAARNLGREAQIEHDERYAMTDEFMEVVYKLWEGSWEDDAVVHDRVAGIYADPAKVHPIGHKGRYYSVPGIFLCEPSRQRTPVLYQAGTSDAGAAFAGRHAEGVFISGQRPDIVRRVVDKVRAAAAAAGRDPRSVKFFAIMTVVTAPTDAEAKAKFADYKSYASIEGNLARLSGITHVDIAQLDLDQPLEYSDTPGIQGILANFTKADPSRRWTPRDIADFMSVSSFGPVVVGSAATVADALERWVAEADIEGFNLVDVMPPASFSDFIDLVVPELQRRGRMWRDYEGETLRESIYQAGQQRVRDDHPAARYRRSSACAGENTAAQRQAAPAS
jgi:FMN-dependent oxidoreductase (nitrilotriacetate monooxygenase family)